MNLRALQTVLVPRGRSTGEAGHERFICTAPKKILRHSPGIRQLRGPSDAGPGVGNSARPCFPTPPLPPAAACVMRGRSDAGFGGGKKKTYMRGYHAHARKSCVLLLDSFSDAVFPAQL